MRSVVILLVFAAAFGAAALWQSQRVRRLTEERELAGRIQDGEVAPSESGLLPAGWARVVIGRPSGVDPIGQGPAASEANDAVEPVGAEPAAVFGDFEKTVEPGESLTEIARAHYGTAAHDVVNALARYNGIADPRVLASGVRIKLPALDRLAE